MRTESTHITNISILLSSLLMSMFSPSLSLIVAWIGVIYSTRREKYFQSCQLFSFSHAGSLIFASRILSSNSSDVVNYYDVYIATCSSAGAPETTLFAFGVEIGLPLIFKLLSVLGLCGLSPAGLVWALGFGTSSALLLVMSKIITKEVPLEERSLVIAGLCLLFPFFFTTQLARQAIASIFVIAAIWLVHGVRGKLVLVVLGSFFHLSTPIILILVSIFKRKNWLSGVFILPPVFLVSVFFLDLVIPFLIDNYGAIDQVAKLSEYVKLANDAEGPRSDVQTVVLLLTAGALLAWRSWSEPAFAGNAKILLGLGLVTLPLLSIPLAATRLLLPIGWFAIGIFIFLGLSAKKLRKFGWVIVFVLLIMRSASYSLPSEHSDHALWFTYPPINYIPGYWLFKF
jgi:hypothetical protein